jgi:hypothetical protein
MREVARYFGVFRCGFGFRVLWFFAEKEGATIP